MCILICGIVKGTHTHVRPKVYMYKEMYLRLSSSFTRTVSESRMVGSTIVSLFPIAFRSAIVKTLSEITRCRSKMFLACELDACVQTQEHIVWKKRKRKKIVSRIIKLNVCILLYICVDDITTTFAFILFVLCKS